MAHADNTFSWLDLAAPDLGAATRFYGELFGWESREAEPVEESGGYRFFLLEGRLVAGFGPPGPGEPPSWRPYVQVADADAAAAAVGEAGGTVVFGPVELPGGAGRVAVFTDPPGAVCCVFEPGAHRGAEVVGLAGAFVGADHATRDVEAAKRFYGQVFGWAAEPAGGTYELWRLGDAVVGGLHAMEGERFDGLPPHWLCFFGVQDAGRAAAEAERLGGRVAMPARTMASGGRDFTFAVLADPNGAPFGILET